jgi:hypothetical protein
MKIFPGWWTISCKADPNCLFGGQQPWLVVPPPPVPPLLVAATRDGVYTAREGDGTGTVELLREAYATPSRLIVPAAESGRLLDQRGRTLAPRVAVFDTADLTFLGALGQTTGGGLVPVRGVIDALAKPVLMPCVKPEVSSCPKKLASQPQAVVATLSGIHATLFVLVEGSDGLGLLRHDVPTNTWSEISLMGPDVLATPLAVTYHPGGNALYAVDRTHEKTGTVRLVRIGLGGRTEVLAQGFGPAHAGQVHLTAVDAGGLLMSVSRDKPERFEILHLDPHAQGNLTVGMVKGKGRLLAEPFLDGRGLQVAVLRSGKVELVAYPPSELEPPQASSN